MNRRTTLITGLFLAGAVACKGNQGHADGTHATGANSNGPLRAENVSLTGAGATFPYPLYSKWMAEYNRLNPGIKINYQSIGSGGGIRQITAGTVDFGASDAPMTKSELEKAPAKLAHLPMTIGAVAIPYNLPEVSQPLKLSGETLVEIYLGNVKTWNDPQIAATNDGVALPAKNISVVYRTDGSGTTAVFTEYLASVNPAWKDKVGVGKSVKWPVGLGAKGNEGVAGQVKTTPGALGYVELAYALQNQMPVFSLKNKAGQFIKPEISAITAAAEGTELSDDLTVSLVNGPGEKAYPIAAYSYILVYENTKDPAKAQALAKFLWWAARDGQKFAQELHYAPLPSKAAAKVEEKLKTLRSGDQQVL